MVTSSIIIENKTTKDIIEIEVGEIDPFDFWKNDGSPKDFNGQRVKSMRQLNRKVEMYALATHCPYWMKFIFDDGSYDDFKIRQVFAKRDAFNFLEPKDKEITNASEGVVCICDRIRTLPVAKVKGDKICPHLEVGKKTHDINFIREWQKDESFAIRIVVRNTADMDALEKALDKDKKATRHYNSTIDKALDLAAEAEQEAIDALSGIEEHKVLRGQYEANLKMTQAEQNAESSSPDTLSNLNKIEANLQDAMKKENASEGNFHNPAESILNQLQIKEEATKYAEQAKEAQREAEAAAKTLTQADNFLYSDMEKIAEKYEEAVKKFGSSLDFFKQYAKISQNNNEALEEAARLLQANEQTYNKVQKMQLVYAVQEMGLGALKARPQFDGEELVEVVAETLRDKPGK